MTISLWKLITNLLLYICLLLKKAISGAELGLLVCIKLLFFYVKGLECGGSQHPTVEDSYPSFLPCSSFSISGKVLSQVLRLWYYFSLIVNFSILEGNEFTPNHQTKRLQWGQNLHKFLAGLREWTKNGEASKDFKGGTPLPSVLLKEEGRN